MNAMSQEQPVRMLIVDDQENWRIALRDAIDDFAGSFEIETAASYDEAERKLKRRAFDVIVADQRTPGARI